jgi:hypothetical protein
MTAKSGRQLSWSAASIGRVEALVVVRAQGSGQMRSGGEAEDADAVGIDLPLGGVSAHQAYGALRIFKGCGRFGM